MPKIKVEKQMTLPELIEYAWENGVRNKNFTSSENGSVGFDGEGLVTTIAVGRDETFTFEVEKEATEDTCLLYTSDAADE